MEHIYSAVTADHFGTTSEDFLTIFSSTESKLTEHAADVFTLSSGIDTLPRTEHHWQASHSDVKHKILTRFQMPVKMEGRYSKELFNDSNRVQIIKF